MNREFFVNKHSEIDPKQKSDSHRSTLQLFIKSRRKGGLWAIFPLFWSLSRTSEWWITKPLTPETTAREPVTPETGDDGTFDPGNKNRKMRME